MITETIVLIFLGKWLGFNSDSVFRETLLWILMSVIHGHYEVKSEMIWDEISRNFKVMITFLIGSLVLRFPGNNIRFEVGLIGVLMFIFATLLNRYGRIWFRKYLATRTLLIGTNYDAFRLSRIFQNNRFTLTKVEGFIHINGDVICKKLKNKNAKETCVYEFDDVEDIIKTRRIEQVIIAIPGISKEQLEIINNRIHDQVKMIRILPDINFLFGANAQIVDYDGEIVINIATDVMNMWQKFLKRLLDIVAGCCGCLLLLPLTLFVRHENHKAGDYDPIFFTQERIGLDGKPIKIYKYRSMVPNAERVLEELMASDPKIKQEYLTNKKLVNDPRVTKVGHFLRKSSLDEFPQFINVLKGEMSFVGPRPYLYREKDEMGVYYQSVIKCKPGITGMWQANGRSDVGFKERLKLDDYYYRNWSLKLDVIIIYKTVKSVIYGKGAL